MTDREIRDFLDQIEGHLRKVDMVLAELTDDTFDDLADAIDAAINETRCLQANYADGEDNDEAS